MNDSEIAKALQAQEAAFLQTGIQGSAAVAAANSTPYGDSSCNDASIGYMRNCTDRQRWQTGAATHVGYAANDEAAHVWRDAA